MGTTVEAWTSDVAGFEATVRWFDDVEQRCSRFVPDSELSRINRDMRTRVPLSPVLRQVVSHAADMRRRTEGLLDIGVGASVAAWGYDRSFELVESLAEPPDHLRNAPEWSLDGATLARPVGTKMDLGGIAKGWTCDTAVEKGFARVVSAGGDIRSAHVATRVPVVDPWGETVALVALGQGALATSSTTRRRWAVGDREAHHLIDPRSGRPSESPVLSATVTASTAVEAEGGAKAVLMLGEDGLAWADEQSWIRSALVIWHDGSVYATRSLELTA